ncbi:NTP transferase domain-containing protein [Nostoc sp. FACHB-110]|uniref:nucleotidyltransferase family protein n=1 Tax=Nostoc sp. FACHB-110 TaxID=2692834 RepID=UPI0016893297|nr:nucleotidyltransferase family protein [Nostoc sp. FACHB-110]MBD2439271.1 nucleotidyltransferase family protein [Nostoc sp. FACHB-110]
MSSVGLIILAAGASTRMGTPKQLLQYNQQSLIRHVAQIAIASVCQPVIVVLGSKAEVIQPEIQPLPIHIVINSDWHQGMSSSICAGIVALNAISPNAEAVVLMLCDQPLISTQLINHLVEIYHNNLKRIVACEYAFNLGVPALFPQTLFEQLMNLSGAVGAKFLIKKYAHNVVAIPFPEGLIDLDTPEDYAELAN